MLERLRVYTTSDLVRPTVPLYGVVVVVTLALFTAECFAQRPSEFGSEKEDSLRTFLQGYVGDVTDEVTATRYSSAFVKLSDDGAQEAIVYLTSDGWCGSGGCTALILAPQGSSYRVITKTTITRLPIRVLASKSHGWHDLGVWVQGGGIRAGYEAKLLFDGKTYPGNPSTPPARRTTGKAPGKVIMSLTTEDKPLYP